MALHVYPQDEAGELACLYVSKAHENQGYGRKLMAFAENLAREKGLKRIFALSTQAFSYLQQKGGFAEGASEALPSSVASATKRAGEIPRFWSSRWRRAAEWRNRAMAADSKSGLLLDGFVVFVYFAAIIAIGLYKGRGSRNLESFAVGDRNIPWWAVLASILAAEISAATFLGAPGEGYEKRNFTYAQLALGTILARIIIAYVFIKPYYDFGVVSIYEYLLLRFGRRTKNTASAIFLITRALASGTRSLRRGHRLCHGL